MNTGAFNKWIRLALLLCLAELSPNMMVPTAHANDFNGLPFQFGGENQVVFLPVVFRNYCPQTAFFDDFSNPDSGWPTGEDSFLKLEYLNGEYMVTSKQAGYLYLFRAPRCTFEANSVEMDFRWDNETGSDIGLLFGIVGNFDEYYFLDVNTDYQEMQVWHRDANGFSSLTPVYHNMPLTRNGPVANHLKVSRDGYYVTVYVNDSSINVYPWGVAWPSSTDVGFALSPYLDIPMTDARFDNFSVTGLSGAEIAAFNTFDITTT